VVAQLRLEFGRVINDFFCAVGKAAMDTLRAVSILNHITTSSRDVVESPVLQVGLASGGGGLM